MAYAPPVTLHNYTNIHAALLERPLILDEARASVFVPLIGCAELGCERENVGVLSSPTRTGVRASRPPVGGLAFLRHVRLGAIMCSPPPLRGWGRAAPPLSGGYAGRNLEFDSFSKSHSWAGYVCFVLLRECISFSVTYDDSCN